MTQPANSPSFPGLEITAHPSHPNVYTITLSSPPENRLNVALCQTLIRALRHIESLLNAHNASSAVSLSKPSPHDGGAVIISSFSDKFFCTGLDLYESDTNPHANSDGFFPLLATLMDYPYVTVACITGHTFGGAGPFSLSTDYRIMNSERGFFSMPPVNLGLHFDGIGALPRSKLGPKVARRMLLEAERWTGKKALEDGIVDFVAEPAKMRELALEVAVKHAPRAKMGVYSLLRNELWPDAGEKFRRISYVHRRREGTEPKAKI